MGESREVIQELPPKACFDLREADPSIPLVDLRSAAAFAAGHPAGAVHVPLEELEARVGALAPDPERRLIVVGELDACRRLEAAGYAHLVRIEGGFDGARDATGELVAAGWRDAGLPVEPA